MSARHSAPFAERKRRNDDQRHGTLSGAKRHSDAGEDPCDACRAAKAEYDKRWRSGDEQTRRNRLSAQAQARAYSALAKAHPEEYRRLYLAFKENLLREVESA
jgi:hypothetical protein